jgi:probable F420-dependent oxidoreductase
VKIRIGVGLGGAGAADAETFSQSLQEMERCGFDSLWLSEVLSTPVLGTLAGLAYAAGFSGASGASGKLKLGTTLLATGRNPVRLAKELATIDRLSNGRLLLVFVPGLSDGVESQAIGVPVRERGAVIEEVLPLVRRLWTEQDVSHTGPRFSYENLTVSPRPVQNPLEVWLGGTAKSALRRAGELSDGWLPSLCTPEEASAGRKTIQAYAAQAGRTVDPEHFGISLTYARDGISDAQQLRIQRRRPDLDPAAVIPVGYPALRDLLRRYIDVGFSKFVIRAAELPTSMCEELRELADAVLSLQT